MGKTRLLLSILIPAALLFSLFSSEPLPNDSANSKSIFYNVEQYVEHTVYIVPAEQQLASKMWIDMEKHPKAVTLSRSQMLDGGATIYPVDMPVGERSTLAVVLTNGGIKLVRKNSEAFASPLFAMFDASISGSKITYLTTKEFLVVQWQDLRFDHPIFWKAFSFQATMYSKDKTFEFVYKMIPYDLKIVRELFDGFSGLFGTASSIKNKDGSCTVDFNMDISEYEVKSGTVISVTNSPYCAMNKNCKRCVGHVIHPNPFSVYSCAWCPSNGICVIDHEEFRSEHCPGEYMSRRHDCPIDFDDFKQLSLNDKLKLLSMLILPIALVFVFFRVMYLYCTLYE